MPPPNLPVDKHGFPIPGTFETPPQTKEPQPRRSLVRRRWLLLLLIVGVVALVAFHPQVREQIRELQVHVLANSAQEKWQDGELKEALSELDQALEMMPDNATLLKFRARIRLEAKDFKGSLEDCDRLVKLDPKDFHVYLDRSAVHNAMQQHQEALDDANLAYQLGPHNDAQLLNQRAYARALAGKELEEGLKDVEEALQLLDKRQSLSPQDNGADTRGAYLDTRGYLHYLLGDQDKALADLQAAIDLLQKRYDQLQELLALPAAKRAGRDVRRQRQFQLEQWGHTMSVLYHHRGLVYQKLGDEERAEADLRRGKELGYNPANGVL